MAGPRTAEALSVPDPGLRLLSAIRQGLSCLPSLTSPWVGEVLLRPDADRS